jgi:hypothetical protein
MEGEIGGNWVWAWRIVVDPQIARVLREECVKEVGTLAQPQCQRLAQSTG